MSKEVKVGELQVNDKIQVTNTYFDGEYTRTETGTLVGVRPGGVWLKYSYQKQWVPVDSGTKIILLHRAKKRREITKEELIYNVQSGATLVVRFKDKTVDITGIFGIVWRSSKSWMFDFASLTECSLDDVEKLWIEE
jgi:hypothetical protein